MAGLVGGKGAEKLVELIQPVIEGMGYELVRVLLSGRDHFTLQVMIERQDRAPMTVDHCAEVSRAISATLDVADPIDRAYTLEVSSPGIDRPLTRTADFTRFAGHEARIEVHQPIEGRKRFRGRLAGMDGDAVRLDTDDGSVVLLPFGDLRSARLVLTDELIAAADQGL